MWVEWKSRFSITWGACSKYVGGAERVQWELPRMMFEKRILDPMITDTPMLPGSVSVLSLGIVTQHAIGRIFHFHWNLEFGRVQVDDMKLYLRRASMD